MKSRINISGLALGGSVFFCLFFLYGEIGARILSLDTMMIKPLLRDMPLHPQSYRDVPSNPVLLYELAPNTKLTYDQIYKGQVVEINQFGFRDDPRTKEKAPHSIRIICLGASTVYGHAVGNHETYPFYLERILNDKYKGLGIKVEVWNAGIAGSVLRQNVEIAKRVVENYSPDILIFYYTNRGARSILAHRPFEHFFREDPSLFWENLTFIPFVRTSLGRVLFNGSYLWRSVVVGLNYLMTVPHNNPSYYNEDPSLRAFAEFCRVYANTIPIFMVPHVSVQETVPEFKAMGAKTISLFDPGNLPAHCGVEYFDVHPPPHVYRWAAGVIARELVSSDVFVRLLKDKQ